VRLTLLQPDHSLPVELLFLRCYRARSDGWRDNVHCIRCLRMYRNNLRPMTVCRLLVNCDCCICTRQPPSLLSLASNTLFYSVLDIKRFVLSSDTTYEVYAHVHTTILSHLNFLSYESPFEPMCFPINYITIVPVEGHEFRISR
jgi:hypothetical protein